MNLDDLIIEFHNFMNQDIKWTNVDINELSGAELKDYVEKYFMFEEKLKQQYPIVYGTTLIHKKDPDSFVKFQKWDKAIIEGKKSIRQELHNRITEGDNLEDCIAIAEITHDPANYHKAKSLLDPIIEDSTSIRDRVDMVLDSDYVNIESKFFQSNWKAKDIKDLKSMREQTSDLIEKGRYMEDSELVYRSAELKDEMDRVLDRLVTKRNRGIKAKVGVIASVALTTFFLFQPYIPPEKFKETYVEIKTAIKNLFENNISQENPPENNEAIQQPYEKGGDVQTN